MKGIPEIPGFEPIPEAGPAGVAAEINRQQNEEIKRLAGQAPSWAQTSTLFDRVQNIFRTETKISTPPPIAPPPQPVNNLFHRPSLSAGGGPTPSQQPPTQLDEKALSTLNLLNPVWAQTPSGQAPASGTRANVGGGLSEDETKNLTTGIWQTINSIRRQQDATSRYVNAIENYQPVSGDIADILTMPLLPNNLPSHNPHVGNGPDIIDLPFSTDTPIPEDEIDLLNGPDIADIFPYNPSDDTELTNEDVHGVTGPTPPPMRVSNQPSSSAAPQAGNGTGYSPFVVGGLAGLAGFLNDLLTPNEVPLSRTKPKLTPSLDCSTCAGS